MISRNTNPLNTAEKKFCFKCKLVRPKGEFYRNASRRDGCSAYCWECMTGETTMKRLRKEALHLLGDCCKRCGFSDPRALCIDHLRGNGGQERGSMTPMEYYKRIIKLGHSQYQILCANCNMIKRIDNKESRLSKKVRRLAAA